MKELILGINFANGSRWTQTSKVCQRFLRGFRPSAVQLFGHFKHISCSTAHNTTVNKSSWQMTLKPSALGHPFSFWVPACHLYSSCHNNCCPTACCNHKQAKAAAAAAAVEAATDSEFESVNQTKQTGARQSRLRQMPVERRNNQAPKPDNN